MESPSNEVIIADEDEKCGHIYYHKQSMLLKYFCLFCDKIYDNIHHYCEHLSEHVYETSNQTEQNMEQDLTEYETSINSSIEDEMKLETYEGSPNLHNKPNTDEDFHQHADTHEDFLDEYYMSIKTENEEIRENLQHNPINDNLLNPSRKQPNHSQHKNKEPTHNISDTLITSFPLKRAKEPQKKATNLAGMQFTCYSCKHNFPNLMCLKEHRCKYQSFGKTPLIQKCTDCNELFDDTNNMNTHIREVHHADEIICRFCGRSNFDSNEALKEHIYTKHDDSEEIFKCYICGRRYYLEANLLPHVWRHAKRVPQCCVVCGKMTLRIQHHMKFKHSPRPTRLLQCSICNKTFSYTSSLSRHKLLHKLPRTDISKTNRKDHTNIKKRRKVDKWNGSSVNCSAAVDSVAVETQTAVKNIL